MDARAQDIARWLPAAIGAPVSWPVAYWAGQAVAAGFMARARLAEIAEDVHRWLHGASGRRPEKRLILAMVAEISRGPMSAPIVAFVVKEARP